MAEHCAHPEAPVKIHQDSGWRVCAFKYIRIMKSERAGYGDKEKERVGAINLIKSI